MKDKDLRKGESEEQTPEILENDYPNVKDQAVVVDEEDRTVLLTEDETIIINKEKSIGIVPKNRPRKVYAGMWGPAEIATVGMALLAILAVIVLYLFFVLPANRELEQNRTKRDALEQELTAARKKYAGITDTETYVAKLVTSVDDFETRFLPVEVIGRTALYQRLNALIGAYRLTNTTGPDYRPLEISEAERRRGGEDESGGREKLKSIFPGVFVTVTVEGSYQNLRGFIREIETSDQFIVISSVELEPAENEENADEKKPPAPSRAQFSDSDDPTAVPTQTPNRVVRRDRGRMRGQTVTLRIEMAAYFRRPGSGNSSSENIQPIGEPTPGNPTGNQQN